MRSLTDQLRRLQPGPHADNTTPMMPMRSKTPLHGRRFVYGYSLDGSDFPCYLVWPWRTDSNSFFLLESQTRRYVALDQAGFLHPLGLRHFYDGFSLRAEISINLLLLSHLTFMRMSCLMTLFCPKLRWWIEGGLIIKNSLWIRMPRKLIGAMSLKKLAVSVMGK